MSQSVIYKIANARILTEDAATLHVSTAPPLWLGIAALIGACSGLGFLLLLLMPNGFGLFGAGVGVGLAALVAYSAPVEKSLTLAWYQNQLRYETKYWLRWPQTQNLEMSLGQLVEVTAPTDMNEKTVEIWFQDDTGWVLSFNQLAEAAMLHQRLQRFVPLPPAAVSNPPPVAAPAAAAVTVPDTTAPEAAGPDVGSPDTSPTPAEAAQFSILQQLESWRNWFIFMGVVQMFAEQRFSSWGALLIVTGLASLYFAEAPMLVVYVVTLVWAGLSNLFFGDGWWRGLSFLQFFWAYQLLQQTRHCLRAAPPMARTARWFPWLALGLGWGALGVTVVFWGGVFSSSILGFTLLEWLWMVLAIVAFNAGILSLATGLASGLARLPYWGWGLAGGLVGGLVLLLTLGLRLLVQ